MHSLNSTSPRLSSDAAVRNMFEARKRVFVDLLKWDVPVLNERYELDQFDTSDAQYLILAGKNGSHKASARLLRTDRPHILGELFSPLCDATIPSGPQIREITRFCIEPTLDRIARRDARNQLVTALVEYALDHRITAYTAVANRIWYRQIAAFGWKCRELGAPRELGGETLVALHIDIDAETARDLAANGIYCRSEYQVADTGALQ